MWHIEMTSAMCRRAARGRGQMSPRLAALAVEGEDVFLSSLGEFLKELQ